MRSGTRKLLRTARRLARADLALKTPARVFQALRAKISVAPRGPLQAEVTGQITNKERYSLGLLLLRCDDTKWYRSGPDW